MVIQNINASFSKLFPNYVPRPPLPRKVGGHDPPAPMGAPPCRALQYHLTDGISARFGVTYIALLLGEELTTWHSVTHSLLSLFSITAFLEGLTNNLIQS